MCMLTYLPSGVLPNIKRLRNGTVSNRDGHGWAIVVPETFGTPARIITGHGMNADAVIESFRLAREQHPDGPALFHSRYTTGGVVGEYNCHPYFVWPGSDDSWPWGGQTILAHNGVLSVRVPKGDKRSDTRYFAEEWGVLLYPGSNPGKDFNLNSKRGRRRLREFLGSGNKFVILTINPVFKRYAYIVNENQGIWEDDDCWYSNSGYKEKTYGVGTRYSYGTGYYGSGWDSWDEHPGVFDRLAKETAPKNFDSIGRPILDKGSLPLVSSEGDPCDACGAVGTIQLQNWCEACGTCLDCWGDAYDIGGQYGCECCWPTGTTPDRKSANADYVSWWQRVTDGDLSQEATESEGVTLGPPTPAESPRALPAAPETL